MANPLDGLTQDQSGDDDTSPPRRVYIYGDGQPDQGGTPYQPQTINAPLAQAVAPEQPNDLMAMIGKLRDYVNGAPGTGNADSATGDRVVNRLLGTGGEQRYQTWPERMVREGTSAPGDVLASTTPSTSESLIAPAQSVAALAGGGALTETPGVGSLGSGPLRTGTKAISTEPAPVFYSALEHAVDNSSQKSASPEQWLGTLKNTPGVKQEELQWSGVGDWLKGQKGKVSKEDVQAYLDANKTEIKDVTKSRDPGDMEADIKDHIERYWEGEHEEGNPEPTPAEREATEREIREDIRTNPGDYDLETGEDDPKYESYQLPGGENYREHLLTLPSKSPLRIEPITTVSHRLVDTNTGEMIAHGTPEAMQAKLKEMQPWVQGVAERSGNAPYRSSHWDEPNVLAHVRTNDRNVGGKKSLHIEEIQSDWHQQGRKQGYKEEVPKEEREATAMRDRDARNELDSAIREAATAHFGDDKSIRHMPAHFDKVLQEGAGGLPSWAGTERVAKAATEYQNAFKAATDLDKKIKGVPDAPFKTTWPELALKRMIRHAAENGYDRISWTPGEAQAARYDLSKQIKDLRYLKNKDGTYELGANQHPETWAERSIGSKVPETKLADYVGKDVADKIIKDQGRAADKGDGKVLSGLDLKVGGEGMREFYDKMLPKMVEKIGKAHGVKVKQDTLPPNVTTAPRPAKNFKGEPMGTWEVYIDNHHKGGFKDEAAANAFVKEQAQPVHYFDLPQSLKDHAIGKGFPLYMRGIPFPLTPVDHDPFKKKEK